MRVCPRVPAWLPGESLPQDLCYAEDGALSESVGLVLLNNQGASSRSQHLSDSPAHI